MFGASGSMFHTPAQTKNFKVHTSFLKKNREKLSPRKESFHVIKHHPVPDKSPKYPEYKFKLKINASQGKVEVINTITSEQLSSIKSSVSPKPVKPKKTEKEYLNVRIAQDVALANEPVHGGIADSVKTKKRRCKDKGSSIGSPEYSFSRDPPLMLSPKKRKARKNIQTSAPSKKWKSEASLNQKSHVHDNRKSFGTSRELYSEQDQKKGLWTSREVYNECYNKKSLLMSRQLYDKQDNEKSCGFSKKLFNEQDKTKSLMNYRAINNKQNNSQSLGISKEQFNRIETISSVIPNPTLIPKRETLDLTPPFDLIFEMEREFFQKCNTMCYRLEEVESTVTDPVFKHVAKKFQESEEKVVSEYLAEGCPDNEEIDTFSFKPVLAEKNQHSQESFNHRTNLGNVFLSCASSQELVIASYEDAIEVEVKAETIPSCLESPPYGSQDSGYTSMTSPTSDDPEYKNAKDSKSVDRPDRPLYLTDVQFLKLCHDYSKCGGSKKWSAKKLVNNHNSKHIYKVKNNPTTKKNSQLSMIKIISNKFVSREEPRKEFSPRGNEHAKALQDRRVVYLGNIPSTYTDQYLREKFKRFGEIEDIKIKSKESDELDIMDYRLLASQPLRGNSSNSVTGSAQKGKTMKYFGFVTFKKIAVAREVFDKRRELCTWPGGSINYGGRREFVREDYADFDAEANNLNPGCSYKQNQENEVDYTQLLKKEQEKRGLISPNSKRPQQHSRH